MEGTTNREDNDSMAATSYIIETFTCLKTSWPSEEHTERMGISTCRDENIETLVSEIPTVSKKLTNILNRSGFSETDRKAKIECNIVNYTIMNIKLSVLCKMHCCLSMGSRGEGTTAEGMNSDIDMFFFNPLVRAHCTLPASNIALGALMIRDDATPAGYVKLRLVQLGEFVKDQSEIVFRVPFELQEFDHLETDTKGRLLLTNQLKRYTEMEVDGTHGPAEYTTGRPGMADHDYVRSYVCDEIPDEMLAWFDRRRAFGWPNKDTLDLFRTMGCFVVPVGHPTSAERDLEWRLSFSRQEQHLMRHLNSTQYHCFMMLKLIKKFLIKKTFGNVLTSYHCKTLLFYTIEENEQSIWKANNLLVCLHLCLIRLHVCLNNRNIPNYFIPNENMFVKFETMQHADFTNLKDFVEKLSNDWHFLHDIRFANIGQSLRGTETCEDIWADNLLHVQELKAQFLHISLELSRCYRSILPTSDADVDMMCNIVAGILKFLDVLLRDLHKVEITTGNKTFEEAVRVGYYASLMADPSALLPWYLFPFNNSIVMLARYYTNYISTHFAHNLQTLYLCTDINERELRILGMQLAKAKIQSIYAMLLAATFFKTEYIAKKCLVESLMLLELTESYSPVRSGLIKAAILLRLGLKQSCKVLLQQTKVRSSDTSFLCCCYDIPNSVTAVWKIFESRTAENYQQFTDIPKMLHEGCIFFERSMLDILPVALTFEAYRSFGTTPGSRTEIDDYWFDNAVISPLRFLYYLQYLSAVDNDRGEAAKALHSLENDVLNKSPTDDVHLDTGLNILGDIYIKKGWTRLALRCFKKSLKLSPLRFKRQKPDERASKDERPRSNNRHNAAKWHIMFLLFCRTGGAA